MEFQVVILFATSFAHLPPCLQKKLMPQGSGSWRILQCELRCSMVSLLLVWESAFSAEWVSTSPSDIVSKYSHAIFPCCLYLQGYMPLKENCCMVLLMGFQKRLVTNRWAKSAIFSHTLILSKITGSFCIYVQGSCHFVP